MYFKTAPQHMNLTKGTIIAFFRQAGDFLSEREPPKACFKFYTFQKYLDQFIGVLTKSNVSSIT